MEGLFMNTFNSHHQYGAMQSHQVSFTTKHLHYKLCCNVFYTYFHSPIIKAVKIVILISRIVKSFPHIFFSMLMYSPQKTFNNDSDVSIPNIKVLTAKNSFIIVINRFLFSFLAIIIIIS